VTDETSTPAKLVIPTHVEDSDGMDPWDLEDLHQAVELLENPSFIARITDLIGQPLEQFIDFLPSKTSDRLQVSVRASLEKLLNVAVRTMDHRDHRPATELRHKMATAVSGAVGGFFGAPALAAELPVTTSIILRSIADIARSEGEDVRAVEVRLACLEVFALGGSSAADDASETGYFAVRAGMAKVMADAAKYIAERGLAAEGGPVVARFIAAIAARFSTVVSEKVAAQAVPVLGAVGGASINVLFMNHFQDVARGHFTVRRLERRYGPERVREAYRQIAAGQR
jgi:hypothetical protein